MTDSATFEALFFEPTRAQLNWHRLRREKWPCKVQAITTRKKLGALRLPWTATGELMDKGAQQIRVRDAAALLPDFPAKRRADILRMAGGLDGARSGTLAFAAVKTKKGPPLLIDGCHRACALMLTGGSVSVALFVLDCPPSAASLVDLEIA